MQQVDSANFNVVTGENITLTVDATQVAEDLAVVHGDTVLRPVSSAPAVYKFQITAAAGPEFLDISCHFSAADPDTAFYQFHVQGSNGGGQFNASSVRKQDSDWDITLRFRVKGN